MPLDPILVLGALTEPPVLKDLFECRPEKHLDELRHGGAVRHLGRTHGRLHPLPQLGDTLVHRGDGDTHRGEHDDVDEENVLGQQAEIPVTEEMRIPDAGKFLTLRDMHATGDQPENENGHGRDTDENRQVLDRTAQFSQPLGPTERAVGIGTNGAEHIAGFCPARTQGGTIAAVMTQENIRVCKQFVLQSPLGQDHLPAGEGLVIGGEGAGDGTGCTLVTLLQRVTARLFHRLDKIKIGLHVHRHCFLLS